MLLRFSIYHNDGYAEFFQRCVKRGFFGLFNSLTVKLGAYIHKLYTLRISGCLTPKVIFWKITEPLYMPCISGCVTPGFV